MEKSVLNANLFNEEIRFIGLTFLGCGLMTLGSLIRIPFIPVPFTLQTLAIFIWALTQSPKQAFASAVCYLLCATAGLPVLDGKANPLWIAGKCGGYLVAFPIAAYGIARMRQAGLASLGLLSGQALILFCGWIWLAAFIGAKAALVKGVLIFIPSAVCKALAALAFVRWRKQ
ncbi:MAG TPA: biotin transporter BioY [Chlamydiales bacterium]|jgi:biotin transport system substrate-specific component|nr:biotin transporter BioY [Chlamydiales bacterium]